MGVVEKRRREKRQFIAAKSWGALYTSWQEHFGADNWGGFRAVFYGGTAMASVVQSGWASIPAWQRAMLLGLLLLVVCSLNLFGNPIVIDEDSDELWGTIFAFSSMGFICAQPTLLAMWMALSNTAPQSRITVGLALMQLLTGTAITGVMINEDVGFFGNAAEFATTFGLQLIIVFVPLLALRRWTWWRIQLPNADRQSASLNDRFSGRK